MNKVTAPRDERIQEKLSEGFPEHLEEMFNLLVTPGNAATASSLIDQIAQLLTTMTLAQGARYFEGARPEQWPAHRGLTMPCGNGFIELPVDLPDYKTAEVLATTLVQFHRIKISIQSDQPDQSGIAAIMGIMAGFTMGFMWRVVLEKYAIAGKKSAVGAKDGHESQYGTAEEREATYASWQADINAMMSRSHISFNAAQINLSERLAIPYDTIRKHTRNPKPRLKKPRQKVG